MLKKIFSFKCRLLFKEFKHRYFNFQCPYSCKEYVIIIRYIIIDCVADLNTGVLSNARLLFNMTPDPDPIENGSGSRS